MTPEPPPRPKRVTWRQIAWHALALPVAGLFVLPLFWMLASSLRAPGQPPPRGVEWFPNPVAWDNYAGVFALVPFGQYLLNSLVVTTLAVLLTLVTASWAGWAMAQLPERWRRLGVTTGIGLLLVPFTALWLPRLVVYRTLGLIDSYGALLFPALMGTSPLFVLLFYWAARRIPSEYVEAARLEGASLLTIWWRIFLPLSTATVLAVAALTFIVYWGDFVNPLLYLKSQKLYTLPVGLQHLFQMDRTNWPYLMAGAVVMTLPPVGLFLLAQRFLLQDEVLTSFGER